MIGKPQKQSVVKGGTTSYTELVVGLMIWFLVAPIFFAIMGTIGVVIGIKFGQEKLKGVDMTELKAQLGEDYPWLYSLIGWFKELEIGVFESFVIGACIFLLAFLAIVRLFSKLISSQRSETEKREAQWQQRSQGSASPSKTSKSGYNYGGSGESSKPEPNPLFRAVRIERSPWSDDRIFKDDSRTKVASVDGQTVRDLHGHKIATIKDGRIIDEYGGEIGRFKKGLFSGTTIEHTEYGPLRPHRNPDSDFDAEAEDEEEEEYGDQES